MIKILFVPNPMPSHIVPLIALDKLLNKTTFKTAFLLPQNLHLFGKKMGVEVLDIDREHQHRTNSEMIAFSRFKPDVVIDDLNFTTAFATRFANIPRIAVVRTGILPFEEHKTGTVHSSPVIDYLEKIKKIDLPSYGIWKPNTIADLFVGNLNIIPSIPSIENLSTRVESPSSYIYSGPLVLSDEEIMNNLKYLQYKDKNFTDNREEIQDFIDRHKPGKIVYFTHGITEPEGILNKANNCLRYLLRQGFAVITSVKHSADFTPNELSRLFSSPVLPMHQVCSQADVMIHHCGSATYSYQLLYQVPAIIVGSNCYDRDEVGMQLHRLNAGTFISSDLSNNLFEKEFENAVSGLQDHSSNKYKEQKSVLSQLHVELITTRDKFDFEKIVVDLKEKMKAIQL